MARTNSKYTSINFNHIHEKNVAPNPNNLHSSSPNAVLAHKNHGRMLVLTRPVSKPAPAPTLPAPVTPPQSPSPKVPVRVQEPHHSDQISLRPLGRTGAVSLGLVPEREREAPRPIKYVPPHLRSGFAGREEPTGPAQRQQPSRPVVDSYGQDGRPKSGGGYEKVRGELEPGLLDRPRSSGNRPSSTR